MTSLFRRLACKRVLLLGSIALVTALVIQSGELANFNAKRRLRTTRSLWTSASATIPQDNGLIGRDGQLHYWFGVGQSLLMLPADVIAVGGVALISRFREPPWWLLGEETVVTYITSPVICMFVILVCFHFLKLLGFTLKQSIVGALTLLFGTTFLHYTQNFEENNCLLFLTLTGLYFQYAWFKTGSKRSLFWGSLAFGADLLIRLPAAVDLLSGALFIFLCLWYDRERSRAALARILEYARISIPCYAAFFLVDRSVQYYRFGSFFNTYLHVFVVQFQRFYPGLDMQPGWPWSTPLGKGFLGPLITPEKSIFLFDPLIILSFVLALWAWKKFAFNVKAFVIAMTFLLLADVIFYAKYYDWNGDPAWGDRFVTTPVELLSMLSIPILMRHRSALKSWIWNFGKAITVASAVIQLSSIFFWHRLELQQMGTLGHPTFVLGLRFLNIVAFATGKSRKWGLSNPYTQRWPETSTPYFFPFLLMRQGIVSGKKLILVFGAWICLIAVLIWLLLLIKSRIHQLNEQEQELVGIPSDAMGAS